MPIRAVWFDVGEVLVDETREYGTWRTGLGYLVTRSPPCSARLSHAVRTAATSSSTSDPGSTWKRNARPGSMRAWAST